MLRIVAIALALSGCTHLELRRDQVLVRHEQAPAEAATVKQVLPNGDLVIEGPTVSGVVRAIDLAIDGSVRSAYILSPSPCEAGRGPG
jgi:hypothetical protein